MGIDLWDEFIYSHVFGLVFIFAKSMNRMVKLRRPLFQMAKIQFSPLEYKEVCSKKNRSSLTGKNTKSLCRFEIKLSYR
jgi:hypothetical protein